MGQLQRSSLYVWVGLWPQHAEQITDHDEKSLLAFNFFNFVFPAAMFYMFTILIKQNQIIVRKMIKFCCFIPKPSCQFLNVFPMGYFGLKADYINFYLLPQSQYGTFGCLYSVATSLLPTCFGLVMVFVGLNGVCVMCVKEENWSTLLS